MDPKERDRGKDKAEGNGTGNESPEKSFSLVFFCGLLCIPCPYRNKLSPSFRTTTHLSLKRPHCTSLPPPISTPHCHPSSMPITATHNIDTVIDGQIYIGKCVFTV
jgi:hypothetical protein